MKDIITLVVSCIMMIVGVTTFIINITRAGKADNDAKQKSENEMRASLLELNLMTKNINTTTNDIKADVKALNANVNDIDLRVSLVEKEQKTMWNKIDELKESKKEALHG